MEKERKILRETGLHIAGLLFGSFGLELQYWASLGTVIPATISTLVFVKVSILYRPKKNIMYTVDPKRRAYIISILIIRTILIQILDYEFMMHCVNSQCMLAIYVNS